MLLIFFNVRGQDMNWENGRITFKDSANAYIRYGKFSSFKIKDINLFLYNVVIEGKRIELQTPVPTELQTLFRLPSSELEATSGLEEVEEAITKGMIISKISPFDKATSEQADAVKKYEEKYLEFVSKAKTVTNNIEVIKLARIKLVNMAQKDVSYTTMRSQLFFVTMPPDPSANYRAFLSSYEALQKAYDEASRVDASSGLKEPMDKAKNILKAIQDESPVSLFTDVDFLYTELDNPRNFIAVAPPVQGDGDFVNYNVSIIPSRTNVLGANKNPKNFDFDIPVKGGWKTDFSVGPTFSFGDGAKDEKYYYEPTDVEGQSLLKQRDNNNVVSPGIAAMMHFYKRSGKDFSWGGMLGVGAGFQALEDADVSFYTGLSGVLGKSQKVMLNAGISFLKVERLKEGEYTVDKIYDPTVVPINNVTEKVFKSSFFISISYNLTNRIER